MNLLAGLPAALALFLPLPSSASELIHLDSPVSAEEREAQWEADTAKALETCAMDRLLAELRNGAPLDNSGMGRLYDAAWQSCVGGNGRPWAGEAGNSEENIP